MRKLPIGKMNVLRQVCPAKPAKNADLKKGYAKLKNRDAEQSQFNTPTLCIVLRKAA